MPACARALAATLAATLACKSVIEGAASLPRYPVARGFSTVGEKLQEPCKHVVVSCCARSCLRVTVSPSMAGMLFACIRGNEKIPMLRVS